MKRPTQHPSFLQKMAGKVLSTGEHRAPQRPRRLRPHGSRCPPLRTPGAWVSTQQPVPPAADPGRLGFHTAAGAQRPHGHQLGDPPMSSALTLKHRASVAQGSGLPRGLPQQTPS